MKIIRSILLKSKEIKDFRAYDVDTEWNYFKTLVQMETDTIPSPETRQFDKETGRMVLWFLSVAASLILIFASIFLFKTHRKTTEVVSTEAVAQNFELSDGSKVVLDPNSTMEYYLSLDDADKRIIKLKGSAVLDISSSILPCRVYHDDIFIEVLGTSFSIVKKDSMVSIKNISGSFKVAEIRNRENFRIMYPGDVFDYKNGQFINPLDTVVEKKPEQITKEKPVKKADLPPNKEVPIEVQGRKFKLLSVINDFLIKFNKKKIKLDKKSKPDMNAVVTLDDINKPYLQVLQDLKKQGVIDYREGDCADCYIIFAPRAK